MNYVFLIFIFHINNNILLYMQTLNILKKNEYFISTININCFESYLMANYYLDVFGDSMICKSNDPVFYRLEF